MDFSLARQPIFDVEKKVLGYELLFRSGLESCYHHWSGDHATSSLLDAGFFPDGIENITRGKKAFINFTRNLLLNEFVTMFPNDRMAVEILDNAAPDYEIIDRCGKLKDLGYTIVLDDYLGKSSQTTPLIDVSDIVKVDFQSTTREQQQAIPDSLGNKRVCCLAERIESVEDYYLAQETGYSYFQGYFFEQPEFVSRKSLPSYKMNYLRILQEINQPDICNQRLEEIFKQDVSLSYKLMTYINSPYFGFPNEIRSIRHALTLLGTKESRKWLSLIALSSMGRDKCEELVVSSLFRANLCEAAASVLGLEEKQSDLFLLGLFSLIDAFLDRPMQEIMMRLPLADDIKNALLLHASPLLPVYRMVVAYEKGDWEGAFRCLSEFDNDGQDLPALFIQTVKHCNQLLPVH